MKGEERREAQIARKNALQIPCIPYQQVGMLMSQSGIARKGCEKTGSDMLGFMP